MCRHKGYTPEKDEHIERWNLEDSHTAYEDSEDASFYATSYMQIAATTGIPIIMRHQDGHNISADAFWGILPPWEHDFDSARKKVNSFVNIRSETVKESKLYSPLLKKKQRCLIPCSYYFEHHHFDKFGKKGEMLKAKDSVPFLVKAHRRPLFAVPALYSHWYDRENKKNILTYSMFTVVANDLLTEVHNGGDNPYRMPLVTERDMEDIWLDPESSNKAIDEILNFQIPSSALRTFAVAPLTGKKAKQGEAVIEEESWGSYDPEIERIKEIGRAPQLKPETV